jgi:hypothetical protein
MAKKPKKDIPIELGKLDDWDDIPPLEEPKKNLDLSPMEPEKEPEPLPELEYVPVQDEADIDDKLDPSDIPYVRAINMALLLIPIEKREFCLLYVLTHL